MEPGAVRQIAALDSAAVFILPKDDNITINQIRETRVEPVTGEEATRIASELLQNARGVTQMNGTILSVLQKGAAKVKYNKAMDLAPKQQPAVPAVKAASPPSQ